MVNVNWRGGLAELVEELRRQKQSKIDFVADVRSIGFQAEERGISLVAKDPQTAEFILQPMKMSERALSQYGERMVPVIPGKFGREMANQRPEICADLFNKMSEGERTRVLFRCLDGKVRAALSSKYRIFDDLDIAFTALDTIKSNDGTILECAASDSRMEIKFTALHMIDHIAESRGGGAAEKHISRTTIDPNRFKSMGVGAVAPFVRISHSSVGEGGLGIGYGLLRLSCTNGAVVEKMMNQVHLGASIGTGVLTEETIAADSKAIMLKARDLISASLDKNTFKRLVQTANNAASQEIESPTTAIANLVGNAGLTEEDHDGILSHFLRDYDQNRWGLAQAVSRYSQDIDDFEIAGELENIAGNLIRNGSLLTA